MRFAQGKLREGPVAVGSEILRFAQDDRAGSFCWKVASFLPAYK